MRKKKTRGKGQGGQKLNALIQISYESVPDCFCNDCTVPLQLFPPTLLLPCFLVVVLQFAKQLDSLTLLLQMLELVRLFTFLIYPRANSHVTKTQQNKATRCVFKTF